MNGDKPNVRYPLREAREYVRNLESVGDLLAELLREECELHVDGSRRRTVIEGALRLWESTRRA